MRSDMIIANSLTKNNYYQVIGIETPWLYLDPLGIGTNGYRLYYLYEVNFKVSLVVEFLFFENTF